MTAFVRLPGTGTTRISTPDSAALSLTGDLDVRGLFVMDDWTPAAVQTLLSHYLTTGNQRSWRVMVTTGGNLQFIWSVTGGATVITKTSTVAAGASDGTHRWIRVTHDVDNGAAGNDVAFYTSTDSVTTDPASVSWTQLGTTVTTAGTTSHFDSNTPLNIGAFDAGAQLKMVGNVYYVELRSSIAGTIVASPDFRSGVQTSDGGLTFVDSQTNTWTLQTAARWTGVEVGRAVEVETANPVLPLISREVDVGRTVEVETASPITPFISDLPITANLILHLDASVLGLTNNDPVTTWNDLSPSGLVLTDGAFTPPTFIDPSLNGLGGVEFPSNNTALEDTSSVSLAGPRTIFLVVHTPDEDATWRYIHPQGAGLLIVKGPGAGNFIFGSDGGSGQFIEFTDVAYSDTDVLFTFVQQTTGAFVRADQVQKVSGNLSSVPAITTVRFGNTGGSAGSGGISFVLHEVVMYDGVLSSGDIDLVEDYLFDKWFGAPATITVNQAPEVELAQPITPLISREVAVGQAVEAELGQAIDPQIARRVTVNQASETELGQSVTPVIGRMVPVGTAAEVEAANPVTPRINRVVTIGIATEVELARLISPLKPILVPVQTAVERELARLVTPFKGQPFIPGITCEVLTLGVDCAILALNVDCEQP